MKEISIGECRISKELFIKPYIIAEAGVNHEGSIEKAKLMIKQAASAGADAIKFQTYKAGKLASRHSPSYWDRSKEPTESQYELFRKYDAFWKDEFVELSTYAKEQHIDFLSTPFDFESADFLDLLMPAFKIASADITNLPFLRYVAKKGKPILLSTGASTISEIWRAIEIIEGQENDQIVLLHCILNYPTPLENANIAMISDMNSKFEDFVIGYSDHTLPETMNEVLTSAWLLGANVIEKHFTFDKSLPGNDHYHAMDEEDLRRFIQQLNIYTRLLGHTRKHFLKDEELSRNNARRSLVAKKAIPAGKVINLDDIDIKRPGTGISPELYDCIIGSTAMRDIEEDELLNFGDFKSK